MVRYLKILHRYKVGSTHKVRYGGEGLIVHIPLLDSTQDLGNPSLSYSMLGYLRGCLYMV